MRFFHRDTRHAPVSIILLQKEAEVTKYVDGGVRNLLIVGLVQIAQGYFAYILRAIILASSELVKLVRNRATGATMLIGENYLVRVRKQ